MNISDILLNLFESIWWWIYVTLRISWSSRCRWASTLSSSSWSYSFEHIVATHWRSIAMWWLSLNTINWSNSVFNYLWIIWIFFRQISMTRLIWILSTILVLIYSTQIKFLVNNSWILWHSWLSWSNWSLHRIVHNLSFNLTFRMSKLQANFSWWLTLIIWIITSLLVHVSSGAIYDARLGNSIILLISIGIHPFVLLSINRWLFWNVLLIGLLVAILSLMI